MRKLMLMTLAAATIAPLTMVQAQSPDGEGLYQDRLREHREADRQRFEDERRQWEQRRQLHERQREKIQSSGRWDEASRLRWEAQREQLEADRQAMEQRRNRREEAFNHAQDAHQSRQDDPERRRPPSPPPVAPYAFPQSYAGARGAADGSMRPARRLAREDRVYRGPSGRYYCWRLDGTTGAIVTSARATDLLGRVIAPGSSRTIGTLSTSADTPLRQVIVREGVGCR
jgi:hypothetical protein